jgi:hypothetical protein
MEVSNMNNKLSPSQLYNAAVEQMPTEHISHWCSDLYLKVTPVSEALIENYEYRCFVKTFIDAIDHKRWYEIPFAAPFRV